MKNKWNNSYKKEYIPNFNKMYTILGGLIDMSVRISNKVTNKDLEQLCLISNSCCTNFIDSVGKDKKLRFSKIASVNNIIRNNYKGQTKVNIIDFSCYNQYGKEGVFIAHEI